MPPRSPRVWLVDIRTEIAGIQELTKDADLATFGASWAMKRAVQHGLLIIAEAAKHLPPALKTYSRRCRGSEYTVLAIFFVMSIGMSIRRCYGR